MTDGSPDAANVKSSKMSYFITTVVVLLVVGGVGILFATRSTGPNLYASTTGQPERISQLSGSSGTWHWTLTINNALDGMDGPPPISDLCLRLNGNWFPKTTNYNCQFGPLPDVDNIGVIQGYPNKSTLVIGPAPLGTSRVEFYYYRGLTSGLTSCTAASSFVSEKVNFSVTTRPLPAGTDAGRLFVATLPSKDRCFYNLTFLSKDNVRLPALIF
jgi:hypothetical protein